jgi:5-methyltetrahydropteroyltriglutamate--homocysteine methyltransferase
MCLSLQSFYWRQLHQLYTPSCQKHPMRLTLLLFLALQPQTSTSLQFVPVDVTLETSLPPDVAPRLAFATQKLSEIVRVAKAACDGSAKPLDLSAHTGTAPLDVGAVGEETPKEWFQRSEPYEVRREKQLANPPLATTTIGSFPQTQAIRQARLLYRKGQLSEAEYDQRMAAEIGYAVGMQDALGLDVLVHGEPERTDMVEHFGINLNGFAFTKEGWVQSYGASGALRHE